MMDKAARDFLVRDEMERHLESLSESLDNIDPRQHSKVTHRADVIMLSALMGVFSNCQTWNEIADFARERIDFIRTFFPDVVDTPAHDTLRRFFSLVRPDALEGCYRCWAQSLRGSMDGREDNLSAGEDEDGTDGLIAIDGKTIKGAMNDRRRRDGDGFLLPSEATGMEKLHMVSAFLVDQGISLGQERVSEKENEIVAIPRLLDDLDIHEGNVVTIDAMGTQREIAKRIVGRGANYLLEVKRNQPTLWEAISRNMEDLERRPFPGDVYKTHKEHRDGHGLLIRRECRVCSSPQSLGGMYKDWPGLRSYGVIETGRMDEGTGKSSVERHYFITSLDNDPGRIMELKRRHWGIENGLHWQLDITFNEDDDRKRKNSAQNFSLLNKMSLAILKSYEHRDKRASIKRKRMMAAWSESCLRDLLIKWINAF